MQGWFSITDVLLLVLVLVDTIALMVLAHLVGVLFRRIPPRSARLTLAGPEIGERPESLSVKLLLGGALVVPARALPTMVISISPTCSACNTIAPIIRSLARTERDRFSVLVVALYDDSTELRTFLKEHGLEDVAVTDSGELRKAWNLTSAPLCIVADADGKVRGKGIVNRREDIEGLLRHIESAEREQVTR